MKIIGMKQNSQVEKLSNTVVCNSMSAVASELRLGDIKRSGGQVFRNEDGYTIRGVSSMPTVAFVNLLNKQNNGVVEVNYKNDLAGNDQISETEEPLWSVDKDNGEFRIKRNF